MSSENPSNNRPQAPALLKVALGLVILFLVVNLFLHVLNNDDTTNNTIDLPENYADENLLQHSDPVVALLDADNTPPVVEEIVIDTRTAAPTVPVAVQQRSQDEIDDIKQKARTIQVPVMAVVDDIPRSLQKQSIPQQQISHVPASQQSVSQRSVSQPQQEPKLTQSYSNPTVKEKSPVKAPVVHSSNEHVQPNKAKEYHEYLHQQSQKSSQPAPVPPPARAQTHNNSTARIYIHIRSKHQARKADSTARLLKEYGFNLPGKELLNRGPNTTEIRYFRASDKQEALHIAQLMSDNHLARPKIKLIKGYAHKAPARQFEIWFSPQA